MKRLAAALLSVVLLTGCGSQKASLDRAMELRAKMMASQGCAFDAVITADYGNQTQTFSVSCEANGQGDMTFTVKEPQTIAGITGKISGTGGALTFDDQVLLFEILSDGLLSPVCGPWVMLKSLQSGYLNSCGAEGDGLRVTIDDSYKDKALHLDVWLGTKDVPERCEIYWEGRRLLTMNVKNFVFL